jgi:hypothetical protein
MVHHTDWPRRIGTSLAIAVAMSAAAGAFAAATAVADPAVHETTTSSCCDEQNPNPTDPLDPNFSYTHTVRTLRTSPNSPEFNGPGRTPTSHERTTYTSTFSGSATDPSADAVLTIVGRTTNNTTLNFPGANAYTDRGVGVTTYADGRTETMKCVSHTTRPSAFSPKQTTSSFTKCH